MKKIIIITALALAAGVLLAGCCSTCRKNKTATMRPIEGVVWHLIQFNGEPVNAPDKYEMSFFNDGRVAGIGECNRFFGKYELVNANGSIKMGPMGSTMMACPENGIETPFLQMLEKVHLYQFENENLYLFVDNKVAAVFEPTNKKIEE